MASAHVNDENNAVDSDTDIDVIDADVDDVYTNPTDEKSKQQYDAELYADLHAYSPNIIYIVYLIDTDSPDSSGLIGVFKTKMKAIDIIIEQLDITDYNGYLIKYRDSDNIIKDYDGNPLTMLDLLYSLDENNGVKYNNRFLDIDNLHIDKIVLNHHKKTKSI